MNKKQDEVLFDKYFEQDLPFIDIKIDNCLELMKLNAIAFSEWMFDINGGLAAVTTSGNMKLNIPQLYELYQQSKTKQ